MRTKNIYIWVSNYCIVLKFYKYCCYCFQLFKIEHLNIHKVDIEPGSRIVHGECL